MEPTRLEQRVDKPSSIFAPGPVSGAGPGGGEGTDRKLKKQKWPPKRIALVAAVLFFVALVAYGLSTTGGKKLNVEAEKLTIAAVAEGPFQEFISVTGNVLPRTTVYLDAVEGGRVEEVYVREGAVVEAGQPLLRLSNSNLQLSLLNNEAALTEQINNLQNMRFQVEQNRLNLRQQLLQMDYEIQRLARVHDRNRELVEKQLISRQEYERVADEYSYWQRRRDLTMQSYRQDSLAQAVRLDGMEVSVDRMRRNFAVLQETLANLTIRAPVAGHLTALDAEVGQLRTSGSRFGQIDVLDGYRVRAAVDEFYITRVNRGQTGVTQPIAGTEYEMIVTKIFPEVRDGRFEVDLEFAGEVPADIRRGQTIRFRLNLGDVSEAVLLPRGGFYQTTGGNWVYVVDPSGGFAERRPVTLGRQNTQHFEVLEGLRPGERVVTSGYDTFGDADRLILK